MDHPSRTGRGELLGTIAYMSPEHIRGNAVDHRADIWALGVLLHEMLTGARPFGGTDWKAWRARLSATVPSFSPHRIPDVPAGIDHLLRRALAKAPEQRYASMRPSQPIFGGARVGGRRSPLHPRR